MKNIKVFLIAVLCLTIGLSPVISAKTVKLEFFNQKGEIREILNEIIDDFETKHPNIKVEQVNIPNSRDVLYTRMASGDIPDIVSIFPNESDFKLQAEQMFFMNLAGTDIIKNVENNFLEDIRVNGNDYSFPLTLNAYGIYYNIDKFKELGIKVPETWAEMEGVAEKIKAAGYIPFASSFKEGWTTGHLSEALFGNIAGIPEANEFFLDKNKSAKESELVARYLDRVDFIVENSQEDAAGTDYANAVNLFIKEKALMLPQGIWAVPMIEKGSPNFSYNMFPVPADEAGKSRVTYGIDYALAISADTEYPEEVKMLLEYLSSTEVAQFLHNQENSPSTIIGVEPRNKNTRELTNLIFEKDRSFQWIHFDWEPGTDPDWQSITSLYFITGDRDRFCSDLDRIFGKK